MSDSASSGSKRVQKARAAAKLQQQPLQVLSDDTVNAVPSIAHVGIPIPSASSSSPTESQHDPNFLEADQDLYRKKHPRMNDCCPYVPYVSEAFNSTMFSTLYSANDTRKHYVTFSIGLLTILIVVLIVSLLYNSILKASIIFMKIAEEQAGEADFILTSQFTATNQNPFVNFTDVQSKISTDPLVTGVAPRWTFFGSIRNSKNNNLNISTIYMIMDTSHEEQIGLGRQWPYRSLGENECHVRDVLLRYVDIEANRGQKIDVLFDFQSLLGALTGSTQAISQGQDSSISGNVNMIDLMRLLLTSRGIDLNQRITVNATDILEHQGIVIPPALRPILDSLPIVNLSYDQVLQLMFPNNGTIASDAIGATYTVIDAVPWSLAKYPSALGNVVILDSKYLMPALADWILTRNTQIEVILKAAGLFNQFKSSIATFKLQEYALQVVGLYRDRYQAYLKDQQGLDQDMITLTNSLSDTLGVDYPVSVSLPLAAALNGFQFIALFLQQIFVGVVVMLGAMGVILIFALLLANVEEKTYEYGMLRALGLRKPQLVQIILTMSTYFAIPGIIIGLLLSFGINVAVEYIIAAIAHMPYQYVNINLNWVAVVVPIALGLGIPLISNLIPIRRALSKTLRDSLDITHQTFNETTVKMIRLEKLGLEPWQTALSVLLVILGFVVYYVIPLAFIYQQMSVFFYILNAILLGMLLGLCLVAVVLQPLLERIVLFCIVLGPDRRMLTLIKKNLAGHRHRSRKTFLMFVLAVAFVVFAGVVFQLMAFNIRALVEYLVGTDLVGQSFSVRAPLPEDKINEYLNQEIIKGNVKTFGYHSFSLRDLQWINSAQFSTLSMYPAVSVDVYALTRNYLDVAYNDYFLYTDYDRSFTYKQLPGRKPDVIDSLYKDAGQAHIDGEVPGYIPPRVFTGRSIGISQNVSDSFDPGEKYRTYVDVVCSEAMRDTASITLRKGLELKLNARHPKTGASSDQAFIAKPRAMCYKMPGFFMSSYKFTASGSPVFVNADQFRAMAQRAAQAVNYDWDGTIPNEVVLVKYADIINDTTRSDIMNAIRSLLNPDFSTMIDVRDMVASTQTATTVLVYFFNLVAAIAMILCFFILSISFTQNVSENSWEFGVLRSIGFSVNQLIRAFIYEALALVVSAYFCGTIIGTAIAVTLVAQFNLFLENAFHFDFPYVLFFTMLAMSIICAVLGSYIPARVLRGKSIALVLKGM